MQITNFRVAFKRASQQAQYEGETYGLVEFAGTIDEGEDAYKIAAQGLEKARAMALASVGKAPKAKEDEICEPKESSSEKPTAEQPSSSGSAKSSKAKSSKKSEQKSSKSKPKDETAESDEPEKPGSGDESGAGGEEAVSDADLMEAANVAAKKHTGGRVKKLMQEEFGVTMLRDIAEDARPKFLAALRALDKED